ncbi:MAG: TonB-dependent receptor [Saprospiraceae bacterium]|nr:TonB-dependent receptor [Saprospiraceae bacterium]
MNKYVVQTILWCALIITGVNLQAQSTVKGMVKLSNGDNAEFIQVGIPALGLGTITDGSGSYTLTNVPNGTFAVEASFLGYESQVKMITVASGETAEVNFELGVTSQALNEIVVTGVSDPRSTLESSISITTLKQKDILNSVPRTTAEIFRTIPGVRSESSGGEGNSNITVRGVPVSAGGSRYLLIQEDGLPVLQFGDIAFGTQDQFLRFDNTVGRIEAVRGGSASVLASNSPAGIINFISKTGTEQGGSVATTFGVLQPMLRTDFDMGTPLSESVSFHVGGFYRAGDLPRRTGYTSNNGGQIKANLTKKFDKGFVRLYAKFLNDRAAGYMPMPVQVSGTNASPTWESLPDFDALNGSLYSPYFRTDYTMGGDGNILKSDIQDGMHSVSKSFGGEVNMNIGNGWKVVNRARYSINNGHFLAPFPATAGSYNDIIKAENTATYAGTTTAVNPNSTFMLIHLFNTKLNNFNNFINDFNISKRFNTLKVNAGLYKSIQNVGMSWHWNSYVMEANSDNQRLVDIKNPAGEAITQNGLIAYGQPAWGNCCNRNFDMQYDVWAPYASLELQATDKLNVEAGLRYDFGHAFGNFSGGNGQSAAIDMNGNGQIELVEQNVATISNVTTPVDYNYNILSYSAGLNYILGSSSALFARYSSGGSASADRILFSGLNYTNSDDAALEAQKVNTVNQAELGYKYRKDKLTLNATAFLALTRESNYEATTQMRIDNDYQAIGLELDAQYSINNNFVLRGGLTFTDGTITKSINPDNEGNTPRRLPALMYNLVPVYNFGGGHSVGLSLIGFTQSYAQDNNQLVMPGYVIVNPFINLNLGNKFSLNLSGNNILNALAITEAEEGAITENTNNIVRGRPLPGRSLTLGLRYDF